MKDALPNIGERDEPLVEGDDPVPPVVLPVGQLQLEQVRVGVHGVHSEEVGLGYISHCAIFL